MDYLKKVDLLKKCLSSSYYLPGTISSALYTIIHWLLIATLCGRYYYYHPHFTCNCGAYSLSNLFRVTRPVCGTVDTCSQVSDSGSMLLMLTKLPGQFLARRHKDAKMGSWRTLELCSCPWILNHTVSNRILIHVVSSEEFRIFHPFQNFWIKDATPIYFWEWIYYTLIKLVFAV